VELSREGGFVGVKFEVEVGRGVGVGEGMVKGMKLVDTIVGGKRSGRWNGGRKWKWWKEGCEGVKVSVLPGIDLQVYLSSKVTK
jgi:hypothetical protein